MTYKDLSGPATAAHFHGPAAAGANAPPVVPIPPDKLASPIKGEATLTDAQAADLEAGNGISTCTPPRTAQGNPRPGDEEVKTDGADVDTQSRRPRIVNLWGW